MTSLPNLNKLLNSELRQKSKVVIFICSWETASQPLECYISRNSSTYKQTLRITV